jgi:predicted metal-dependent HD superfamily phosphohydrolase
MHKDRWQKLMDELGLAENFSTYDALAAAYAEKHRRYHTARHIEDCLDKLDSARQLAQAPAEIEIALWFHDAIYDPYKSANEEKSADWACVFLTSNGVDPTRVERIRDLVLATRHQAVAVDPDAQLLVDVDLSILGANEADYAVFEKHVRDEYKWVPAMVFRKKRAEILQSFLDRPRIYSTSFFGDRYEQTARANLARAIAQLSA